MMIVSILSACTRTKKDIDFDDVELNPYGSVCCELCERIVAWREFWDE